MKQRSLQAPLLIGIAVITGVVVLLAYFVDILAPVRTILLDWALLLTAVALLLGVWNLFRRHWRTLRSDQPGKVNSLVMIISLVATLIVTLVFGLSSAQALWVYQYVLVPVESSLLALLTVVLIYAIGRMFYRKLGFFSAVFAITVLFLLATTFFMSGAGSFPGLREARGWLLQTWVTAGSRGVLLGVVLGTLATGLRVIMGFDRPYGG